MENFRFDICFMGVVGADLFNNVITTYVPEDGIMKRDAVQKAVSAILLWKVISLILKRTMYMLPLMT